MLLQSRKYKVYDNNWNHVICAQLEFGRFHIMEEFLTETDMRQLDKDYFLYHFFVTKQSDLLLIVDFIIDQNRFGAETCEIWKSDLHAMVWLLNDSRFVVPHKYITKCLEKTVEIWTKLVKAQNKGSANVFLAEYIKICMKTVRFLEGTGIFFTRDITQGLTWKYESRFYRFYPKALQERVFTLLCVLYRLPKVIFDAHVRLKIIDHFIIAHFAWRFPG